MRTKLHAVHARRINHVQGAWPGVAVLALVVWPPDARLSASLLALAVITVVVLMLRLQRRMRADQAARVLAERQAALADNLQQLVAAVSKVKTPANVIEVCVPEFLHALAGASAAFVIVGEGGRTGEVVRAVGYDEPFTRSQFALSTYEALAHAASQSVIAAFDASASHQGRAEPVPVLDFLASHKTAVAIPFVTAGRTIGILAVSFHEKRDLSTEERDFLLSAGRRTAEAWTRAQAYETAERARLDGEAFRARANVELRERHKAEAALRESETRYRAFAARTNRLYELSAALSESITVGAVAAAIVRHGKIALGATAGSVALLADDRERFETLYGDEYGEQSADSGGRFALDSGLCATDAIETRQPVFVSSFDDCQQRYWRSASIAASGGFASAAVMPLIVKDAAIGVLTFHFTAPVHFDNEYTAMLTSVAQNCAQAIDRARLYDAAQQARADAEAANQSKDDFLSTVSHELRTPLTAVIGWASMLRSGSLDPIRTTRAVEAIFNNATRQAQLIEELLDISRIVSGRVAYDLRELDLDETIRGSIEAIMPQAEAKGVEIHLGAHPSVPVRADARRLEQVFLNLLTNAVKFTPRGGNVTVDVMADAHHVNVRVADDGAGIDPSFLPQVFERFRQGDNSTSRTRGGLGLGLFIARQLMEAHGGSIRAESAGHGSGAAFIVTLPVLSERLGREPLEADNRQTSPDDLSDEVLPSLSGVRVLIVDDEQDVRELMVAALERAGATVTSVGSAAEALEVLTRADIDVDVLLADIAMPGQDGYDLIKATRALPSVRTSRIPAAAVTACARDDERQRALAAGFQQHVPKPIDLPGLVQTVANLVGGSSGRESLTRAG